MRHSLALADAVAIGLWRAVRHQERERERMKTEATDSVNAGRSGAARAPHRLGDRVPDPRERSKERRTRMTGREIVFWWVVAMALGWAAIWQIRGATVATVALGIEATIAVAEIFAFHRHEKKDERRSTPSDAPADKLSNPMADAALDRLNAAEFDELRSMRLSITQARRLLACRDQRGGFQSLDDLDRLAGFSSSTIQDLKDILVGTMPSSPNWPAPTAASAGPASGPAAPRPQVTLRRRRWRRGGILLFVGFVCAATLVLALVLGAAVAPPRTSGACMIVLGVGIIVVNRDMAEVSASLDLMRSRSLHRVLVIAWGAFLAAGGIARILA